MTTDELIVISIYATISRLCTISGKVDKKLSLSIDSIDKSPNLESHRRSKSILKNKSDAAKACVAGVSGGGGGVDPESERLLADNQSFAGISDNSVSRSKSCTHQRKVSQSINQPSGQQGDASSDYSPNKLPHAALAKSVSPPLNQRHRILLQHRSVPTGMTAAAAAGCQQSAKPLKFQTPRQPLTAAGTEPSRTRTPLLARSYVDHLTGGEMLATSSLESETAFYTQPATSSSTQRHEVQQNTSSTQTVPDAAAVVAAPNIAEAVGELEAEQQRYATGSRPS